MAVFLSIMSIIRTARRGPTKRRVASIVLLSIVLFSAAVMLCVLPVRAQEASAGSDKAPPSKLDRASSADATTDETTDNSAPDDSDGGRTTIFDRDGLKRFWLSGQINIIGQGHPSFPAKYSGANSLKNEREFATSRLLTLYTGFQLSRTTAVLFDLESAGGRGISDALGLAGFTNLDVVRNPTLGSTPYIARAMIDQIIPLSNEKTENERTEFSIFSKLPVRRLELRFGKFGLADFFDVNTYASDSHHQFLNWTVDNNGAYDYAADTRGYTFGGIIEYQDRNWGVRFGEALMPKVANGLNLDADLRRAHSENLEVEFRRKFITDHPGVLRLLSYANHANMGSYRQAISNFLAGLTPLPDITAHPLSTRSKYGFGVNFEQPLTESFRIFGRGGWNDGHNESYAYTEVDHTIELGVDLSGNSWRRKLDKVALAYVNNGLSAEHNQYLRLGGLGFLLGDGTLNYGHEQIVEGYYNCHLWRGLFAAFDLQHINNPGYNRDRGPVIVPAVRFHIDF